MKSHISPKGPGKCSAKTVSACPYSGDNGDENHFNTLQEAKEEYERRMSLRVFTTITKKQENGLIFKKNTSPYVEYKYEAPIKSYGKINPKILTEDSWKKFGFSGPNLLKMQANDKEMWFYNQASMMEVGKLNEDEKKAIKFFTSSAFASFNESIFSGNDINENERKTKQLLDSGLAKTPGVNRIVYRGLKAKPKNGTNFFGVNSDDDYKTAELKVKEYVEKNYKIGETVEYSGYQSTSLDPSHAVKWAERDGVVFEIINPAGVNITSISQTPEEMEVLMPRNTKYMVIGVQKTQDFPFSYKSKPSHIIQLIAVDENNEILTNEN